MMMMVNSTKSSVLSFRNFLFLGVVELNRGALCSSNRAKKKPKKSWLRDGRTRGRVCPVRRDGWRTGVASLTWPPQWLGVNDTGEEKGGMLHDKRRGTRPQTPCDSFNSDNDWGERFGGGKTGKDW